MKRIGKIGKLNLEANKKLKQIFSDKEIIQCELCGIGNYLSFAHRHKRIFYRSRSELLSNFDQVLLLCIRCHNILETNQKLTEETFIRLRQ